MKTGIEWFGMASRSFVVSEVKPINDLHGARRHDETNVTAWLQYVDQRDTTHIHNISHTHMYVHVSIRTHESITRHCSYKNTRTEPRCVVIDSTSILPLTKIGKMTRIIITVRVVIHIRDPQQQPSEPSKGHFQIIDKPSHIMHKVSAATPLNSHYCFVSLFEITHHSTAATHSTTMCAPDEARPPGIVRKFQNQTTQKGGKEISKSEHPQCGQIHGMITFLVMSTPRRTSHVEVIVDTSEYMSFEPVFYFLHRPVLPHLG